MVHHAILLQRLPEIRRYLLSLFDPPMTNHQQPSVINSTELLINIIFRVMTSINILSATSTGLRLRNTMVGYRVWKYRLQILSLYEVEKKKAGCDLLLGPV